MIYLNFIVNFDFFNMKKVWIGLYFFDTIKQVIDMDELKKYGKNILINDYEASVLLKYNIDVTKCSSIDEVLLLVDRVDDDLSDEEYDELDYVASVLAERKYYMETNK